MTEQQYGYAPNPGAPMAMQNGAPDLSWEQAVAQSGGGSRGPAIKLKEVGDKVEGVQVGEVTSRHARKYNRATNGPGDFAYTQSGNPVYEFILELDRTDLPPGTEGKIGTLYTGERWRLHRAIMDAVKASGQFKPVPGGQWVIAITGTEQGGGAQPAKLWSVTYTPPANAGAVQAQQQHAQAASQGQPQQAQPFVPPAAPAPAQAPSDPWGTPSFPAPGQSQEAPF